MPCDTRQTSTVEFKATYHKVVAKAMEDLGWQATLLENGTIRFMVDGMNGYLKDGKLTFDGSYNVNTMAAKKTEELKKAYSKRIARIAAKKFGFEFKATKEADHYQLIRE